MLGNHDLKEHDKRLIADPYLSLNMCSPRYQISCNATSPALHEAFVAIPRVPPALKTAKNTARAFSSEADLGALANKFQKLALADRSVILALLGDDLRKKLEDAVNVSSRTSAKKVKYCQGARDERKQTNIHLKVFLEKSCKMCVFV